MSTSFDPCRFYPIPPSKETRLASEGQKVYDEEKEKKT
jgi:hypothetical protein